MFDTIFGLPVHALVVHAVVVLLPVAAIGGALVALWPRARTRFGWLVTLTAVVAAISVFAAQQSGHYLEEKVQATLGPDSAREGALMEAHTRIADNLLPRAIVLAAGLVVLLVVGYLSARRTGDGWLRVGGYVASAAVVAGAVLSVYWVIRIGDAGARAAWTDVVAPGG